MKGVFAQKAGNEMKRKRTQKGFTIVELVIVIAVIAILATTLVPTFGDVLARAQESAAKQAAKNAYTSYIVKHPEQAGAIFVYENNGQYVAIKDGAPIGTYEIQSAALLALGLDVRASLNDTGDGKLFIYSE